MQIEKTQGLSEREYRNLPLLSASDLRTFTTDRKKFYFTKIMGQKQEEEYNRATLIGSLVHCLILEPENFDERYFLSSIENMPTGLMLALTEALYKITIQNTNENGEITCEFGEIFQQAYTESGFKIGIEAVLKKFTGSSSEAYYQQLRDSKAKNLQVVTLADINIANKIVETAKNHPYTVQILNAECGNRFKVYNEIQVESFDILGIQMKGMLDKVIVDLESKTIQIYDLKVVFDTVNFYREYFLKKRADIQRYIYWKAIKSYFIEEYPDFEVLPPIFLTLDSGCFYAPILYPMTKQDLQKAFSGFVLNEREYKGVENIIDDIRFCTEHNTWNTSSELMFTNGFKQLA